MTTVATFISRVRSRLDERSAAFYDDGELLTWLNEGLRDAGRFTKHIRDSDTITTVVNQSEYTLASDVLEVEEVWYLINDLQHPLSAQSWDRMNLVWGSYQNQPGQPRAYAMWGTPPALKMKLFPVPEEVATLSILVRRLPAEATSAATVVDWPPAWDDVIEDYMEMCALRKARDPRWQEAFQFYVNKRDNLDRTFYETSPQEFAFDGYAGLLPRWLTDPGY